MKLFSEKEIAVKEAIEKHRELHDELNLIKLAAGLKPDEYVPFDINGAVKSVYDKYSAVLPATEDEIIMMFAGCGVSKENYHIVKTKRVMFESDAQVEEDEVSFFGRLQYAETIDITVNEGRMLELIKKDKKITPELIAKALKVPEEWVIKRLGVLTKAGVIETKTVTVGEDKQIERTVEKPLKQLLPEGTKEDTVISIKYSYEGPKDDRNRPFCAKMLQLDRLYSRAEIERISLRLGYSVFDRRGGWWTQPDGTRSPACRHRWQQNIIVNKRKAK